MPYKDISQAVSSAAGQLNIGQLVTSPLFHLEEAMSAIELMEPKMDPGCGLHEKAMHYDELRSSILSKPLSSLGEVRVSDLLLGELLNWLSGTLYIQSVHSCLFMVDRVKLPNRDLGKFCDELLRSCANLRHFVMSSGVADEEDFIGYLFGFNDEVLSESSNPPKVLVGERLSLRLEFLSGLQSFLSRVRECDYKALLQSLDDLAAQLHTLIGDVEESPKLSSDEETFILSSIDRSLHRSMLPPGPPRVVRSPQTSTEIYAEWHRILNATKQCLTQIGSEQTSVTDLMSRMNQVRRNPSFPSAILRAILYHHVSASFDTKSVVSMWLRACSGNAALPDSKSTDPSFISDLTTVVHRLLFTLFRSPCRQHRSLKSVLQDLSVMQHRAWALASSIKPTGGSYPKGLWGFVALLGCTVLQLNLGLSMELDLVDLRTQETCIVLFLLHEVSAVKVLILNEMLGSLRSQKIDPDIGNILRYETVVSAIESSFTASGLASAVLTITHQLPEEDLERIFELRSIPLREFPLVKTVSFDECLEKLRSETPDSSSSDECLQWIQRSTDLFGPRIESVLLGSDISLVKKTVLNNKLMLLKSIEKAAHLELKHHPIVPCVVLY